TVKEGQLEITGDKTVTAERVADDAQALRFKLVLEKDGSYRISFTSAEGERNPEPMPYAIHVTQDHAPQVELKKPGQDVKLPVNGVLQLEGTASDDIGIATMALRMKLVDGTPLPPKPYRGGKSFRWEDKTAPQVVDYKDFVELQKVKPGEGPELKA